MMGLARDGGLLLPERIPQVSDRLREWRLLSYPELAWEIMRLYTDLPDGDLRTLVEKSYNVFDSPEVTPIVTLNGLHILELFHGPTLAFKDIALQFLGNLYEYLLRRSGGRLNILGATSGDTGSAAIYGVRGRKFMRIFVMHPHNRISKLQELQMTSVLDTNVFNLAIEGTFDDCQGILKALLNDLEFRDRFALGTVNSINWARVLAQIVYYFYGAFRVMEQTGAERVVFAVPTGNFGNIFAGYLAARMGLPVQRLVLATNENDILARFFNSGIYRRGSVQATISPSMDIQVASNFERYLFYRVGENPVQLRALMEEFARTGQLVVPPDGHGAVDTYFVAGVGDTQATLTTIRDTYYQHGYLLDPHTAVGVHVARQWQIESAPTICLATAHPAKFSEAIIQAVGKNIAGHPTLEALQGKPTRMDVLPASPAAVREYLDEKIRDDNE